MFVFRDTEFRKKALINPKTLKEEKKEVNIFQELTEECFGTGRSLGEIEEDEILRLLDEEDAIQKLYAYDNLHARANTISARLRTGNRITRKKKRGFFI